MYSIERAKEIKELTDQIGIEETSLELGVGIETIKRAVRFAKSYNELENEEDNENKIYVEEQNNRKEISSNGEEIDSLEKLLKVTNTDTDYWNIDKHIVNYWSGNYQVKAWLSPKRPEKMMFPVVSPVEINLTDIKNKTNEHKYNNDITLAFGDAHIGFLKDVHSAKLTPFHDRKAISIALQIAEKLQPKNIIILGDMLDLAEWSDKFIKKPEFYWTTQASLIELGWILAQLRNKCPNTTIKYADANHEARFTKLLINHFIAGYNLKSIDNMFGDPVMSISNLLSLDKLNIEYIDGYPKNKIYLDGIKWTHGTIVRQGSSVHAVLKDATESECFGHIHRQELAFKTIHTENGQKVIFAMSPGPLCRVDGIVPSNTDEVNWQQGIGLVNHSEDNQPILISIRNGIAYYGGMKIEGIDYKEQLIQDVDNDDFRF